MTENKRLLSLDVLRGFDLMLLVALQPVLVAALRQLDCEALNTTLLYQLDHAEWEGMRVWDMVMPLFLFMSGVTMSYSLPKYRTQNGDLKVWTRVVKRFVLLFLLGMLVQAHCSMAWNNILASGTRCCSHCATVLLCSLY